MATDNLAKMATRGSLSDIAAEVSEGVIGEMERRLGAVENAANNLTLGSIR